MMEHRGSETSGNSHGKGDLVSLSKPTRTTRTAMGEYVVPPGGKTLTSLGNCIPAPSDYSPKVDLTKPAAPQYSVAGPYKASKTDYEVSPADHDTTTSLSWRERTMALKGKGKMTPYDIRADAEVNDSVGPLQYRVEHLATGISGPKWSITPSAGVEVGPPNKLVQPVDTHGMDTPGPNYRPNSRYWRRHEKSFGTGRKERTKEGPGPAEYTIDNAPKGPAYSLAKRLPPSHLSQNSPGPGAYDLGTTIGKAQAKSMSSRAGEITGIELSPAPNLYVIPDTFNKERYAATLNYGWCDPEGDPGPSSHNYTITDAHLKKAAAYSISKQTRPCFPEILNYPLLVHKQTQVPGPGSYDNENHKIQTSKVKRYFMGMRAKSAKNEVPGPNHYIIPTSPKFSTPPAFSMGRRVGPIDKRVSPGPASYYPPPPQNASGYSMTKRPRVSKKYDTPGPNSYKLSDGQTAKGVFQGSKVCFKSRASPYVFSGLHKAQTIRE